VVVVVVDEGDDHDEDDDHDREDVLRRHWSGDRDWAFTSARPSIDHDHVSETRASRAATLVRRRRGRRSASRFIEFVTPQLVEQRRSRNSEQPRRFTLIAERSRQRVQQRSPLDLFERAFERMAAERERVTPFEIADTDARPAGVFDRTFEHAAQLRDVFTPMFTAQPHERVRLDPERLAGDPPARAIDRE
jgi:hypothetical protein